MLDTIKEIVIETNSWRDAKKRIKQANFELSTEQLLEVLIFWQKNIALKMTDDELISELIFWSDDGSFEKHLNGFDAIPPQILLFEAKRRRWSVIEAKSGCFMVKPPEKAPIVIKG